MADNNIVRIYDKETETLLSSDKIVVIDNVEYNRIAIDKAKEIALGYGYIGVNKVTLSPEYVEFKLFISVDKDTNDFQMVDSLLEETPSLYGREVTYKEYLDADSKKRVGKIVKYKDNTFHIFDEEYDKSYDKATNSMKFDLTKYKKYVLDKVRNSNDEIRNHGFYFTLAGEEYLQPFREVPTNDMTTLKNIRDETPDALRALKIFREDPSTKERITDPVRLRWLKGPEECPRLFIEYMIKLLNGYHSYLPEAILQVLAQTDSKMTEPELRYIEKNHVSIVLRALQNQIERLPYAVEKKRELDEYYTSKNIKPKTDAERGQ